MTARLVGLISVVLVSCLGAFGFLMDRYQRDFNDELARTVSDVGRRTLKRTLELRPADAVGGRWVAQEDVQHVLVTTTHETFCTGSPGDCRLPDGGGVFIDVAAVRAEPAVGGDMVLKIPTLAPTADGGAELTFELEGEAVPAGAKLAKNEISLPLSVGHFDALFKRVRGRSLAVFFGVFLVGTVLSAGLATRFTRPIRRLDAGIRRLAEGDLDVALPPAGGDEIGRLTRAFNAMADRLRANREREREMVRREKLSALGRLAAGVAHDVRNPLHSINLTLEHLDATARPEAEERRDEFDRSLGIIRGEIERLDRLVGNFIKFAKSERHPREDVDLGQLVRETVSLVKKEAERRNIELVVDAPEPAPPIAGDEESLRAAVLNLVLNSFEAMPDGGRLDLAVTREQDKAVVEVTDSGEGIPPEHRERVFDFAYTTRSSGNGLGLAMVHHCVVEEHGGRIWLDSRPGVGTSVRIALPAANARSAA